ncbi:MAG: hypothetical protein ACREL5_00190 [Gemmatimonadales bacterium]
MRVQLIVGIAFAVVARAARAQDGGPHAQLVASYARTWCGGNDCGSGSTGGVVVGVGAIAGSGSVGVMPEVAVERFHQTLDLGEFGSYGRTDYLGRVSILVRPRVGSGSTSAFLLAGPELTYELHCSYSNGGGSCTGSGSNRIDYGLAVGVGVVAGRAVIQARLDLGLKNFDDSPFTARSRLATIGAGVAF